MKTYEVEVRALLSKEKHDELKKYFDSLANGTQNDAETYTFLTKNFNIKVKKLTSQGKAKITVKNGAEYQQQAQERELPINPEDIDKAVDFVTALGFDNNIPSHQQRIDYEIDGISISLKHETNWGYHVEAEIVVNQENEAAKAKEKLLNYFKKLEIEPMTEEQTQELVNSVLRKYGIQEI